MLRLKASEWYQISGMGKCAAIKTLPEEFYEQYYSPNQLVGQQVDIDGVVYTVAGAEPYAVSQSIDYPNYFSVGILVKES
jgi:hypothetical protein